jgi:hypothetical protein
MFRKGYPRRYSGGAPSAPGDRQRARFPQERRFRAESGALAHIRRGNCTEVDTPYAGYGRASTAGEMCQIRRRQLAGTIPGLRSDCFSVSDGDSPYCCR